MSPDIVETNDQPDAAQVAAAAAVWARAEAARIVDGGHGADSEYLDDQRRGFVDTMGRDDAWLTTAVREGEVVGCAGGLTDDAGALYLAYVAVDTPWWGEGIGRCLLDAAAALASQRGAERLVLTVHDTNTRARRLYEQAGWTLTGRTEQTPLGDELVEYAFALSPIAAVPANRAQVHVLCGPVAAGKTTLAKRLADELPALRLSRDEWMLRLYGLPYDDPRCVAALDPCTALMWDVALATLRLGTSVVLDWNHWSRERRAEARARAQAAGFDVVVHYLDVPVDVAVERARARREAAPVDAHVVDDDGVRHLATIFEPPAPSEGLEIVRHVAF